MFLIVASNSCLDTAPRIRTPFRVDNSGVVQEGVVGVVVFCDCVKPMTWDWGERVGEFCDGGRCVLETICATLCGRHV